MNSTMNPTEHYRDSSLDDNVFESDTPFHRQATNQRNGETQYVFTQQGRNVTDVGRTSSDLPSGPPISYRGVGPNPDPRMHRSFSQRAKGRPFADEAFADDGLEHYNNRPSQRTARATSGNGTNPHSSRTHSATTNGYTLRGPSDQAQQPQPNASSRSQGKTRTTNHNPGDVPSEANPAPRSVPLKDAGNQTEDYQKAMAPDRSPLQKLEGKLTDISKEEKRARVQEAEMRLQGSQTSRGADLLETPTKRPSRSVPRPAQATPAATSNSTAGQSNLGVLPRPSATGYEAGRSKERKAAVPGPAAEVPARQYNNDGQRRTGSAQRSSNPQHALGASDNRIVRSAQQPTNTTAVRDTQFQDPRSAASHQRRSSGIKRAPERPASELERSASHQAALQQLTGEAPVSTDTREIRSPPGDLQTQARRIAKSDRPVSEQMSPVMVDIGTLGGGEPQLNYTAPRTSQQSRVVSSQSQNVPPAVGLGLSNPSTSRAVNLQSVETVDPNKNRKRRSSVSFREPFDKRRPVDEWKAAETAKLTVDDFSPEQVKESEEYKAWWEQDQSKKARKARTSDAYSGPVGQPSVQIDDSTATFSPALHLKCGPLLRYVGLKRTKAEAGSSAAAREYWRGTVMIVTQDSRCSYEDVPSLRLFAQPKKLLPPPPALVTGGQLAPEYVDPIAGLTKLSRTGRALYVRPVDHLEEAKDLSRIEDDNGIYEASPSPLDVNGSKGVTSATTNKRTLDTDGERLGRYKEVKGIRLYADPDRDVTFWRFNIEIELGAEEQHAAYRINKGAAVGFWVPARGQTMNIMFHSCNGFSMSVDADSFSGPDPLWRDVLNNHQTRPFHVMIGGGDQVYNDRVMADTEHFGEWTKLRNPHQKHHAPFTPEMKEELETFYLERYSMWFSQGLFGMANASIPMVNIWDDHDILDGYGSYPDDFMKSAVFAGLGDIAHKYYLLFQHQTVDAMTEKDEPSWILGKKPGPYIQRVSRSVYLELGQRVAFLGLDGRTERTRHDVLSIDTLELMLERCRREMVEGQTKHLIVLLGVPIAYPRLVWLENVLTSRALDPIKALHRAGIVKTKLLNRFDGGVEILDDLDDHWTATHHKDERNILIQDLQDLAAEKSARITILSGDVHLAAVGQFYSNPKLKVPKDKDHRYMPNIISSAIVNTPPPDMMADVLNKRNKVHHLDKYTDENMIPMFTHDVDDKKRNNTRLLPRRNWCSIREYLPGDTPPPTPSLSSSDEDVASVNSGLEGNHENQRPPEPKRRLSLTKTDFNPRNLMRRISSRGAPPNSYRNNADSGQLQRSASLDGVDQRPPPYGRSPQLRAASADHVPDVPALRPSFHRRPTNLSEKAARKGIVPDTDADGKEVHFNDHVNLQGGLDIVLNCEVNQKDPAGITQQYRLLVPALWYDGSSDREKIATAPQLSKRDNMLMVFGLNPRKGNKAADSQGAGNWGQEMTETESYSESEGEGRQERPQKRKFSFFGGKRKKQNQQHEFDNGEHPNLNPTGLSANGPTIPVRRDVDSPRSDRFASEPQSVQQGIEPDLGRDRTADSRPPQRGYQQPQSAPQVSYHPPVQQRQQPPQSTYTAPVQNRQQAPQPIYQPPMQQRQPLSQPTYQAPPQQRQPTLQSSYQPPAQQHQRPSSPPLQQSTEQRGRPGLTGSTFQRSSRPLSYIIGGSDDGPARTSAYSNGVGDGRAPYDPDAAYVSNQHRTPSASNQRSNSASYTNPGRVPNASGSDGAHTQPDERQLRGNGIIGKNIPPTSFRSSSNSIGIHYGGEQQPQSRPQSQSHAQDSDQPRGYSGIEAYKDPKPKRRWSLKERARNMMGSLSDRRRGDEDEWYSDEEEEEYWEGPKRY